MTFFFPLENRAVYEITWKNLVESDRLHMKMWCGAEKMRLACWIT